MLLAISLVSLAAVVALALFVLHGRRSLGQLARVPAGGVPLPPLSIILTALDEAHTIEPALRSLLALDYPALEVIAVDDRSTDGTGEILDRLAAEFPRLHVLHITGLPPGWLGKVHALHEASRLARGEYLLFTDADVHFEPSALRRAVAGCERGRIDHLTVMPDLPVKGALLQMLMAGGVVSLLAMYRPWLVRRSRRAYFGVGAFNLLRRQAYARCGGHEPLRMDVLDDIMLGKLVKRAGLVQEAWLGHGMVRVDMYPDVPSLARGLRKNAFRALDYSVPRLVAGSLFTALVSVWPWAGAILLEGPARWANVGAAAVSLLMHWDVARAFGYSRAALLFLPVNGLAGIVMIWSASVVTLWHRGIDWRGTHYDLEALRRGRL